MITTLAAAFLEVVLYYEELGEKTEVQLTILNMRSGLRYQIAERMFQGRMRELAELSGANPVQWLERPPLDYAGELASGEMDRIGGARWYFDLERRELRYRPRLRSHLAPELPVLRWRVMALYGPARGASGRRPVEGLALVDLDQYAWF